MMLKPLGHIVVVAALLSASTVTVFAADTTVEMLASNEFSPENITIHVGDTVTWVNRDSAVHDSVARDPQVTWNTGFLQLNEEAAVRFDSPAEYAYHCRIHPGMTGRVTVALAPPATDTVAGVEPPAHSDAPLVALAAAFGAVLAIARQGGRTRLRRS